MVRKSKAATEKAFYLFVNTDEPKFPKATLKPPIFALLPRTYISNAARAIL
jgi:hypothetical protein